MIEFYLNGQSQKLDQTDPNLSILDWLRTKMRLSGTKEGCASGDCGACTVLLGSLDQHEQWHYVAMNSCIGLVGALHGKHLITVDALQREPAHPVQTAMVECNGSQCGFCTPGIVMSLVGLHQQVASAGQHANAHQLMEALAGNLCRCTGYRPIVEAGARSIVDSVQQWDGNALFSPQPSSEFKQARAQAAVLQDEAGNRFTAPLSVAELQQLEQDDENLTIGSALTYAQFGPILDQYWPAFTPMLERLGSLQIRNRATLGGNIGNASPIGDMPPPLIALGAEVQLDSQNGIRWLALQDYFLDYKKTVLQPGEFIRAVRIAKPAANERLFIYKISKRLDDDISAVLAAFWLRFNGDNIEDCRLAYGGMAGIPKRALAAETALRGQAFDESAVAAAAAALTQDFKPMSDVRASAAYRLEVAGNLLRRALYEHRAAHTGGAALTVTDYA